jgi:hypothetical protein
MIVQSATRIPNRAVSRPVGQIAALDGLRYERKVVKALFGIKSGLTIEHNPWFEYQGFDGIPRTCCPDILIHDIEEAYTIVVDVKLTWIPTILDKIRNLYEPVVRKALNVPTKALVIAKNLRPGAPQADLRLSFALLAADPLYVWRGEGPIIL